MITRAPLSSVRRIGNPKPALARMFAESAYGLHTAIASPARSGSVPTGRLGKAPAGAYQSRMSTPDAVWPPVTATRITEWSVHSARRPHATAGVYAPARPSASPSTYARTRYIPGSMAPIVYGLSAPPGSRAVCSIRKTFGSSARMAISARGGLPSEGYPNFPLIPPSEIWRIAGHAAAGPPLGAGTLAVAAGSERDGDGVVGLGAAVQARANVRMKTAMRPGMHRVCSSTRNSIFRPVPRSG